MKTILIIEDEPQTRGNLATMLTLEGYRAVQAGDGLAGLTLARRESPDLILCDVSMPELDGFGVLEALRGDGDTANVPLIFLTAKDERRDQRHGMNLGADDYITKPATATELLQAIAARLARQDGRAAGTANAPTPTAPDFTSTGPLERAGLTPREAEVALWVAQGKANGDIATILGATESTIKKHVQNIFVKLSVENRHALALRVLEIQPRR
jgi:DNA-binding NarL/FixJ family response regulator